MEYDGAAARFSCERRTHTPYASGYGGGMSSAKAALESDTQLLKPLHSSVVEVLATTNGYTIDDAIDDLISFSGGFIYDLQANKSRSSSSLSVDDD
nr:hypothetical protein [Tanacetum cinerariifolium]